MSLYEVRTPGGRPLATFRDLFDAIALAKREPGRRVYRDRELLMTAMAFEWPRGLG